MPPRFRRRAAALLALAATACTGTPFHEPSRVLYARPAPVAAPATVPADRSARLVVALDSVAAERDSLMAVVLRSIAGREAEPAEQVFRDIRTLRGVPAGRLVRMMNAGFGRSLGVSCTHCHVAGEWASDAKPQKQVAREMWAMTAAINGEYLRRIPNLRSAQPVVNCTTCHRGAVRPATDLPPAPALGRARAIP